MANNVHEVERQWLRAYSLAVADSNGQGRELNQLRIVFSTKKGDNETPNSAVIQVYNLADVTITTIEKEFSRVVLQAGYQGNIGTIFDGNIKDTRLLKGNGTDRVFEILAADGDKAYNWSVVNTTLAAGSLPGDRLKACQTAMEEKGVTQGFVPDMGGNPLPRGKVMYGATRNFVRQEANNNDMAWSVQDGKMQLVPKSEYLPDEAVVLTSATGLIGSPEQTKDGIKVQCLINPRLKIAGRIKLDNKSIQKAQGEVKAGKGTDDKPVAMDADGFYRILSVEHSGDTHATDWYCNLVCVGIDDTSKTTKDRINK